MTKNLYMCLVTHTTHSDMVIEATSVAEAREIAHKLADNCVGEYITDQGGSSVVEDIKPIEKPDEDDINFARMNAEALQELNEDEE